MFTTCIPPNTVNRWIFSGQDALSRFLIQIAENQSRSIDAMLASQESQASAYRELTHSKKIWKMVALFESIEIYNGSNPAKFEWWLDDMDQVACITNRDLGKELIKKSGGVLRQTLMMMDTWATDDEVIAMDRKDVSAISTMNQVRKELRNLVQPPNQQVSVYICDKYKNDRMFS